MSWNHRKSSRSPGFLRSDAGSAARRERPWCSGSSIPGIRKWPEAYLPAIYQHAIVDEVLYVSQADAEEMARRLAAEEGIFCGPSAAGACCIALRLAETLHNATIVFIVCDRGDRYLSMGLFPG